MADSSEPQQQQQLQVNGLVEVVEPELSVSHISAEDQVAHADVEEVTQELLQQALGVAVEDFQQDGVEYAEVDANGVVSVVQHAGDASEVAQLVAGVGDGSEAVTTLVQDVDGNTFEVSGYCMDDAVSAEQMEELSNNVEELSESAMMVSEASDQLQQAATATEPSEEATSFPTSGQVFTLQTSEGGDGEGLRVTLVPTNASSGAPLGSSLNPIRIIQQGNQYTPVQHLSTDQLSQIMQVVQQQQVAKSAAEGGGSSTLFNPDTNTRIVYRVIYPSELHKSDGKQTSTVSQGQQSLASDMPKRIYKKRRLDEDEDKASDAPELSREEKESRKKHRPRTRSGRVSKPPKHMIKDYKHIHPVDFDDDPYDDSDGGYSDFKYSDDERERGNEDSNDIDYSGLNSMRPKKWKCLTCDKSYIGEAGLARHYRLNPEHPNGKNSTAESNENSSASTEVIKPTNGLGVPGQFSEDSNTGDSVSNTSAAAMPTATVTTTAPSVTTRPPPRVQTTYTSRQASYKASAIKRKRKLKEFLRLCSDEDLMETVLPRLTKVITLWEFLLMKVEKGTPARPHVGDIYREFAALHSKVQCMCQRYLQPLISCGKVQPGNKLQLDNEVLANSLGLEVGMYCAKPIDVTDESFHTQTNPKPVPKTIQPAPRVVELVSKEDLLGSGSKRIIINPPEGMTTAPDGTQLVRIPNLNSATTTASPQKPILSVVSSGATTEKKPMIVTMTNQASLLKPGGSLLKQAMTMVSASPVISPAALTSSVLTRPVISNSNSILSSSSVFQTQAVSKQSVNRQPMSQQLVSPQLVSQQTLTPATLATVTAGTVAPSLSLPSSTQITIPVMLPQGAGHVSLELPSSLAQTMSPASSLQHVSSTQLTLPSTAQVSGVSTAPTTSTQFLLDGTSIVTLDNGNAEAESAASLPEGADGEQQLMTVEGLGEVQLPANIDPSCITQFVQHEGELTALTNGTEILTLDQLVEGQVIAGSNIFQTEDGFVIIENPDGTELEEGQSLPLETVQALLAMETDGQGENVLHVTDYEDMPS